MLCKVDNDKPGKVPEISAQTISVSIYQKNLLLSVLLSVLSIRLPARLCSSVYISLLKEEEPPYIEVPFFKIIL
jgi:hypothetical protein